MNPLTLHVGSGAGLFSGLLVLIVLVLLTSRFRHRWMRLLHRVLVLMALVIAGAAATPFPDGVYWLFGGLMVAWWLVERRTQETSPWRWRTRGIVVAASLMLLILEWPHTQNPILPAQHYPQLCVIGDSISGGLGTRHDAWPVRIEEKYGIPVLNLSKAGNTVADALPRVPEVPGGPVLVLIELGGNDMLDGSSAAKFRTHLDHLLTGLKADQRLLVMFEIPLLPLHQEFGRVQRELAAKHGVALLPKRHLVTVIGTPGGTSDGLHLTAAGREVMADLVHDLLGDHLLPSPAVSTRRKLNH